MFLYDKVVRGAIYRQKSQHRKLYHTPSLAQAPKQMQSTMKFGLNTPINDKQNSTKKNHFSHHIWIKIITYIMYQHSYNSQFFFQLWKLTIFHIIMAFIKLLLLILVIINGLENSTQVLVPDFYNESCPLLEEIVRYIMKTKVLRQPRVAAQLLRLHFHDCFVQVTSVY